MLKAFFVIIFFSTSQPGNILNYYNGNLKLDQNEARELVEAELRYPSDNYTESVSWYLSGFLHRKAGNDLKAFIDYDKCLKRLASLDTTDYFLEISVRKNAGAILFDMGEFEKAIFYYEKALPYANKYSKNEVSSLLYNIANAHKELKNGTEVIKYYYKSLEIAIDKGNIRKITQVYNQLGRTFLDANSIDTAIYYFNKTIDQEPYLKDDQLKYVGMAYHNLGFLYSQLDQFDISQKNYEKALRYKKGSDRYITLMDLGEILLKRSKLDSAEMILLEAADLYSSVPAKTKEYHATFKHLASLQLQRENFKGYVKYQTLYTEKLEKHLEKAESIAKISNNHFKKEVLKTHKLTQESKKARDNFWVVVIVSSVGIFLVGIITFSKTKVNRRLKKTLEKIQNKVTNVLDL